MARPQKEGLDYFPFDVDFFDDDKISAVFVEFGLKGEMAAIKLLCAIYRNGYFIEWKDSVRIKLLKQLPGISEDLLEKIVNRLVKWEFFDKNLFDTARVLSSKGIQKRYFSISRRNKRTYSTNPPHLLVEFPPPKTEFPRVETQLSRVEIPQKESKVKDKSSLRSDYPPSPPTPRGREAGKMGDVDVGKEPIHVGDAVGRLKQDCDWLLLMQQRFGLRERDLVAWLGTFERDCGCRGKEQHESMADVKQHFIDWVRKQKRGSTSGKKGKDSGSEALPDYQRLWNMCQAELCLSVSEEEAARSFRRLSFENFNRDTGEILFQVPSNEDYDYIDSRYATMLCSALGKYFGRVVLQYRVPKSLT